MKKIVIYSSLKSNRLSYIIDFINQQLTGGEIVLSDQPEHCHFVYSPESVKDHKGIVIPWSGALVEHKDITGFRSFEKELLVGDDEFNFDFLAAIFFLLSRAEEYTEGESDDHGRFPAHRSILDQKGLLGTAVVDRWIRKFVETASHVSGSILKIGNSYSFQSTLDVDHMFAYKHKPITIWLGSMARDLLKGRFRKIPYRFASKDPFDTFDSIFEVHKGLGIDLKLFILCAARSKYDKSLPPESKAFIANVQSFSDRHEVGIHPSYKAATSMDKLENEIKLLEAMTGRRIKMSRQHFVRLHLPQTYQWLLDHGIQEDYSMGYPGRPGFRAGTAQSFLWYDLTKEMTTSLRVFPFQLMDVTLKNYMSLDTSQALEVGRALINECREVGGILTLIWHNSSFYDQEGWGSWDNVYYRILAEAKN